MPSVKVERADIYYEVHGDGEEVVVLGHGASGNTLSWFANVPGLLEHYRVILFDHRGYHRSPCRERDVHVRYFASDLFAILDQEKIRRVAVCGHALGAWTALDAGRHPDRVWAAVLSASAGGIVPPGIANAFRTGPGQHVGKPTLRPYVVAPGFVEKRPDMMFLAAQIARLNESPPDPSTVMLDPAVAVKPESLVGYRTPTLVIAGEESQIIPHADLKAAAALIPGSEFYVMPGVGHSPAWENPELYNQVVLDFLARHRPR